MMTASIKGFQRYHGEWGPMELPEARRLGWIMANGILDSDGVKGKIHPEVIFVLAKHYARAMHGEVERLANDLECDPRLLVEQVEADRQIMFHAGVRSSTNNPYYRDRILDYDILTTWAIQCMRIDG